MISRKFLALIATLCLSFIALNVQATASWVDSREHAGDFPLVSKNQLAPIVVAPEDFKVVKLAANDLAADIERVTGRKPALQNNTQGLNAPAVLVGTLGKSPIIDNLVAAGKLDVSALRGTWESFLIATVEAPQAGMERALVIVGSDRRGTAFGVYEFSQAIGVSPWYWWADVTPEKKSTLFINAGTHRFGPPSVKYRGIFINDEDWSLQVWAAKNFEPENGGIGPKTYAKMFELMLRLKANTLWPGMHPTTKPFNSFPQNAKLADDYAIVMGSSHAEPMLRNNVGEWTAPKDQYNYVTHRDTVYKYWEERMQANGGFENIYTLGMRGIHDSQMQGPTNDVERVQLLQKIFSDQRALISKYTQTPAEQVPQMFCAYKEVLGLYRQGLQVPDDVTIVWPDDNFGYVRNFANAEERKRKGGFGVYYHLSYLGAPMSYLWLNTTPPALIWEEMKKSYDMGADRIWIANVGDLKPAEIGTEFFLQMAWDINRWQRNNLDNFLPEWAGREFGAKNADKIGALMNDYYRLNYQRKPEHLQWYMPKAVPQLSNLSAEESAARLQDFTQLKKRAEQLSKKIPATKQDAFFELVTYPVKGSALANIRFLEGERDNSRAAITADQALTHETELWNSALAQGKWKYFMAMEPADSQWAKYRIAKWEMPAVFSKTELDTTKRLSFAIEAENFTRKVDSANAVWEIIPSLGRTGKGSVAVFPNTILKTETSQAPRLEYDVNFAKAGELTLQVYLIPTHPLAGTELKFAVAIDDAAPQIVVFEVKDGSAEWAQGVLNATRIATAKIVLAKAGVHTLKIYGVDAGVVLDKLVVNVDGLPESYLGLPAIKKK